MGTYSGLARKQRAKARELVLQACHLMLSNIRAVHYSQSANRWEGIADDLKAWKGQFPAHSDCSSSATWVLWNALDHFHKSDIVNRQGWKAGYTGTIAQHGRRVYGTPKVGDLVLYGSGWPYEHVAVSLGGRTVFSHGSEAGPFKLDIDYRPDRAKVLRFI